jgi:anti-sigma regulatory factor (Ser/Thr protein kinase)
MITHCTVAVHESSQTFAARTAARDVADRAGWDPTDVHRVGLVATELATNLVKHAKGGEVLISFQGPPATEVELIALDRGPGIPDVGAALRDGHSSAGSPGTGLGAIRRQSEDFDIISLPGGTAVLARLRAKRAPKPRADALQIRAISIAVRGETVCGDAWRVRPYISGASVLVVDGLGHGAGANAASEAAVEAFEREMIGTAPAHTLERIHQALRHTRGAAGAVADISKDRGTVRFSGIGNITGVISMAGVRRQTVSNNGTLGHLATHFREYQYPWGENGILVLHSDGLSARWTLDQYPGVSQRDPSIIAAILYRDFARSRDDATVVVVRDAA